MDQMCESMNKNRILGAGAGRAGNLPRSSYPSRVRSVDSATVHRRRLSLPQEICSVSLRRLRLSKGSLTAEQKSAEGILGPVVGKASKEPPRPPLVNQLVMRQACARLGPADSPIAWLAV